MHRLAETTESIFAQESQEATVSANERNSKTFPFSLSLVHLGIILLLVYNNITTRLPVYTIPYDSDAMTLRLAILSPKRTSQSHIIVAHT